MPTPRKLHAALRLSAGQPERPMLGKPAGATHLLPPDSLTGPARNMFEFYANQMAALGTSRLADAPALVELCECLADLAGLRAELVARGSSSYESIASNGAIIWKPYPAAAQAADASRRVRAMMAELGLTPASAARATGQ